jgi:hypothetical protein
VTEQDEPRRCEHRLEVDLDAAFPLAGHRVLAHVAVARRVRRTGVSTGAGIHPDEARPTIGQRVGRFLQNHGPNAPTAHPPVNRAVDVHDRFRPRPRALRRVAGDDRGEHERRAIGTEKSCCRVDVRVHFNRNREGGTGNRAARSEP